jgi:hypothetical protein
MVGQFTASAATGIDERFTVQAPESFAFDRNYPNPFNPSTTLRYHIPETQHVTLKVFDILGNEVTTMVDGLQPAGIYEVRFDGTNRPSGVYYARLETDHFSAVRRLTLLK